jgi:alkyldihydroxyacetonephosphate synthase
MDIGNLRWWGWGTLDETYSLESRPAFWPKLHEWLALPEEAIEQETPPVALEDISLRASRLDDPTLASLRKLLGEESVLTDKQCRIEHAYGKSYRDLVRIRAGHIPNPSDAVAYPSDEAEIASLLTWTAERDITIIPFGGGSSVLGGVEPPRDERPTITLDMAKLDRVVSVDPESRTACIQAGATGPEIEVQLNEHGLTLGHFPQSFEFSTLGGWIATRAAGQTSIGYGKIEDMTQALRAVTPAGIIETRDVPASATGPSIREMIVGSEGTYGIITEATMRIHPQPEVQDYRGVLFHDFVDGTGTFRELMQDKDLRPSIVRLSDASETAAYAALAREHHGLRRLFDRLTEWYLKACNHDFDRGSALMLLGFDGQKEWTSQQWELAREICRDHGGLLLGRSIGRSWKRDRYAQPYLRDMLLDRGILVDTLETATNWSNLILLYSAMVGALKDAITNNGGGPGYVMTHISHAYQQGASLYSTFAGRQIPTPDPLAKQAQWAGIKEAATDAILAAGGTLSHHHGVGRDHTPWLKEEIGQVGVNALRTLKQSLDPAGTINPGTLLPR